LLLNHPTIEVVAINDLADKKTMAHLLKYDSIHGVLYKVGSDEKGILVERETIFFFHEKKFQIYLGKA
jgi:glyceraldehyde 3-phosphate dehydrogenase